jgi:hypothetical protein
MSISRLSVSTALRSPLKLSSPATSNGSLGSHGAVLAPRSRRDNNVRTVAGGASTPTAHASGAPAAREAAGDRPLRLLDAQHNLTESENRELWPAVIAKYSLRYLARSMCRRNFFKFC